MTAAPSIRSNGSDIRRRPLNSNPVDNVPQSPQRDGDDGSFLMANHETMSNADLYCMTPPAYAQSAADGETSVDAEAMQSEKMGMPGITYTPSNQGNAERNISTPDQPPRSRGAPSIAGTEASLELPSPIASNSGSIPNELPPVYFQQLTQDAAIASVRRCNILPNRPAVWMVKRRDIALSPLAATVLLKEGIIRAKDLSVISQSAGIKRDPNDPLSGIAFATFDTVGDILLGLVEGPVEAAKQVQPLLIKHEQVKLGDPASVRISVLQESAPLMQIRTDPNGVPHVYAATEPNQAAWKPPVPQGDPATWEQRIWSEPTPPEGHRRNSSFQAGASAAGNIAMSTGKGLGRIVGTSLKVPMTFTHAITRGFHNLPKLYGDEVREYENVVDLRSGLSVSAKSFGHGMGDGLKDFFVQPIIGAQKGGVLGFGKGFGKGVGNLVCKPAAGAVGLVGYSFVGVYKELQFLKPTQRKDVQSFKDLGETEYGQAPDQTKQEVVRRWCQINMRQKG